jgi:hypothetical protein
MRLSIFCSAVLGRFAMCSTAHATTFRFDTAPFGGTNVTSGRQIIGLSTPPQMAYASLEDDSLHCQVRVDFLSCGTLGLRSPIHCTTGAVACIRIKDA